ncbi:DEAD-box ATP-dependent RNA helicase [Vigna angularis]|uniref:DEAD-box ATP-dependent RNA helicase n=1 Tax=Phaseolus angularis TaxID=3914 RepID=A0A8T0JVR9_PHAAN|nr:DEAD-box ATP-dependent RNA helicase [Vigna angularis]
MKCSHRGNGDGVGDDVGGGKNKASEQVERHHSHGHTLPVPQTQESNQRSVANGREVLDEAATYGKMFDDLGLAEWVVNTCQELEMRMPRHVQQRCIPPMLEGRHVLGIDETGSGKTAAFVLPILHRLAEHPFGVFTIVVTATRELAFQLAEQFRALGSVVHLRITVVVGGMDMLKQAKDLVARPHLVIATLGRIHVLLRDNPDISSVFSRTKIEFWMLVFRRN